MTVAERIHSTAVAGAMLITEAKVAEDAAKALTDYVFIMASLARAEGVDEAIAAHSMATGWTACEAAIADPLAAQIRRVASRSN